MAYNPASMVSTDAGIAHIQSVIYYERSAVENLKANLPFLAATTRRKLPSRNGKTIRLFVYDTLSANTTPGSEGTVGTGIALTTQKREVSVSQYFDFVSFSDLLLDVAIDPIAEESASEMGYRAALTVNSLVSTEFDTAATADATAQIDLAAGEYISAAHSRQAVMSLRGQNAKPFDGETFVGIIHPFAAYDLVNDNTSGGVLDIAKRQSDSYLTRGIKGYRVIDHMGVKWLETTTVPTTSNYQSSGNTGYHSYVMGKDAFFSVSLGSTEIPSERNFQLKVNRHSGGSVSDPAGVIGATIAYNFKFAIMKRPGSTSTFRRLRSEASIS